MRSSKSKFSDWIISTLFNKSFHFIKNIFWLICTSFIEINLIIIKFISAFNDNTVIRRWRDRLHLLINLSTTHRNFATNSVFLQLFSNAYNRFWGQLLERQRFNIIRWIDIVLKSYPKILYSLRYYYVINFFTVVNCLTKHTKNSSIYLRAFTPEVFLCHERCNICVSFWIFNQSSEQLSL